MLTSRRRAASLKLVGKLATTRTRNGSATSPAIVLYSSMRLELVAQVLLDDVLHVLGEVGQPLLDVRRLGPDPVGDEQFVIVAQVHEGGEVLAQADRVDDRVPHLARRHRREVAQHQRLEQHGSPRPCRRRPP